MTKMTKMTDKRVLASKWGFGRKVVILRSNSGIPKTPVSSLKNHQKPVKKQLN